MSKENPQHNPQQRAKIEQMKKAWAQKRAVSENLDSIANKIGVYSGKGGVGKTTVSVNLAVTLAQSGKNVGILDVDIDCPNVVRALAVTEKPEVGEDNRMIPPEAFGVKVMSMAFFQKKEDEAIIWRGPMIIKALKQMLNGVVWNNVDTLIIDLPPGTGDVQLTLCQKLKISGVIVVSTPQELALIDATKGINMFKKLNVPILGIVENMSYLKTKSGEIIDVFGKGAVESSAKKNSINFLGKIPIDDLISKNGDKGIPFLIENNETDAGKKIMEIASYIDKKIK